jgi:hypothetical protein
MRYITKVLTLLGLLVALASAGYPQATLTQTTLAGAVTSDTQTVFYVASATGFVANTTMAYVDQEAVNVVGVSGLFITVTRGQQGTKSQPHVSGQTIYVGPFNYFTARDYSGSCTSANQTVLPFINVLSGNLYTCDNGQWALEQVITNIKASYGNNLTLESVADSKPVRINSRNYVQTSGSSIGFQSSPTQTVTSTGTIEGAEITARLNSGVAVANIIGLHVSPYPRGTAAGTVSGDVRGVQIEMVTDDAGTRTFSGNVSALRIRSAFSATTITGKFVPIRIEVPETQTNSKTYDAAFEFTGSIPLVWNDNPGTEPSTADGYIKVYVDGNARYIQLYSSAPTD